MAQKFNAWSDVEQDVIEIEGLQSSAGAADAGKIPALNSSGEIDPTMLPNSEVKSFVSAENLTAGDFVYINVSGEAAKADAGTTGNPCIGFVRDSVVAPAPVDVLFEGINSDLSGLTPGDEYFLDDVTAGAITNTAPVGQNKTIQSVGRAISATELVFEQNVIVKKRA